MKNFAASEDHFDFRKCKGRQMLQIPINFREVWGLGGGIGLLKKKLNLEIGHILIWCLHILFSTFCI